LELGTAAEAVGTPSMTSTATPSSVLLLLLPTATQVVAVGQATVFSALAPTTWTAEPGTPLVTATTSPPEPDCPTPTARQVVALEQATPLRR
jgi:hypothetical protein